MNRTRILIALTAVALAGTSAAVAGASAVGKHTDRLDYDDVGAIVLANTQGHIQIVAGHSHSVTIETDDADPLLKRHKQRVYEERSPSPQQPLPRHRLRSRLPHRRARRRHTPHHRSKRHRLGCRVARRPRHLELRHRRPDVRPHQGSSPRHCVNASWLDRHRRPSRRLLSHDGHGRQKEDRYRDYRQPKSDPFHPRVRLRRRHHCGPLNAPECSRENV